ncbi:hypothetical protein [Rheinheimera texasensis]|uniref:hypothetical protein n=1 Tax=Rheinheimera texasensis TaxID=306205 RepID=UPI0032B15A9D
MNTDKSASTMPATETHPANSDGKDTAPQLDQALRQWHQYSRQQHRLDKAQRQALQQLVLREKPAGRSGHWQRGMRQVVALAACILVLVVWLTPPELMYQIEQKQQGLYTIQIHQLAPAAAEQSTADTPTRAQQRQQQYQLVYQDYLHSQQESQQQSQQQVARSVAVWREATADGWQLQSCDHLQLQVHTDLLAALKQQQADQQQWQKLEQSRFLLLTIGAQGQILALKPGIEAPHCAI